MQALEWGEKLFSEQLHYQELGVATLTACFINANRDPDKSSPASPEEYCYFKPAEINLISPIAAGIFFQLIEEEIMPGWVIPVAPIDRLEKASRGQTTIPPIAWLAKEVEILFINPMVHEDRVQVPMGFIGDRVVPGEIEFKDINTKKEFVVSINFSESNAWFTENHFYLV